MDNDFDGSLGRAMAASAGYEARDAVRELIQEVRALTLRVQRLETQVELLKKTR